ncbi:tyrosine-type recombinase/integrase [Ectobacillus ponti]|uniref:Tyrosine-type recombinase/integrase n=1 Tax=Ectobacillus ponti TaxID=2961894 RepID=A0AA41X8E2_9BACI|nr:tyrosine-type recombinase/integrase [Ectobacillus ponti]MCP8970799.1 tyrosine-type recombinase/integrase [Ectobacillus ponti]
MLITETIDEFLMYLEVERNYAENTIRAYAYDLMLFEGFLRNSRRSMMEIEEIRPVNIRRFVQEQVREAGASPRTMQRRISCLKALSRFCVRERFIDQDFTVGIEVPKIEQNLPVYMTLEELQKLFRFLESDTRPLALRNELIFKLLATTGMRRQELVDLNWDQLNLDNQTIRIKGKGKKERLLPLHPIVLPLFQTYMETLDEYQKHSSQPVFLSKNKKVMNPRGLHVLFKNILEKAGLPPTRFSLHHLRHTFATLLLQENKENVDLRLLQELLGHENLSSTQVYTHIDFEQKRKAIGTFKI